MRITPLLVCSLLLGALSGVASAQLDTDGPNAALRIDGMSASTVDPLDHDVTAFVPGTLAISVESNVNAMQPIIFLASAIDPSAPVFPTPWGGSVDIGTPATPLPADITVVGDGINASTGPLDYFMATDSGNASAGIPPRFSMNLSTTVGLNGGRVAVQFIVADPTNAPFFLDNTQAADVNFQAGQMLTLNPGGSGSVAVPFLPGQTFNFHGQTYSEVYVSSKGYVSFGGGITYPGANFANDTALLTTQQPVISAFAADWANGAAASQVVYVEQGPTARIAWGDPMVGPGISHFGSGDLNRFEILLQLQDPMGTNANDGSFDINVLMTDPSATVQNGDGVIGHSPGAALVTAPLDTDLHGSGFALNATAMVEEHDRTGTNVTVGYNATGSARLYNNFHSWNGQTLSFQPNPWIAIPGDSGYASSAPPAPDDVQGFAIGSLDVNGNQILTLIGKFAGFNDPAGLGGTVVFDPAGLALPATILGIRDGTGTLQPNLPNNPASSPYRDGEGLDIVTPPFSAVGIMPGNIQVQIDFNSGASFTRTVALVPTGQTFTSYGIANMDGSDNVTHNLNGMTVSLYNTPYSTLFINQHGYIGFGNAAQNYNESLTSFFAGIPALTGGGTSGPSVAVAWSDLGSTSNTSALYEVTEDMVLGTVRVDYKNQDHWPTSNPAGDFSVTFGSLGPNSLTFDHTGFIPDPATSNTHDFVIGITDGDNTVGTDTNFSDGLGGGLAAAIGGSYITPGTVTPPESFAELVPQGVNPGLGIWTALDIGSVGTTPYGTWSLF